MKDFKTKGKNKIFDYIYNEWIFNRELEQVHDVITKLDTLVENRIATKIFGSEYVVPVRACKFNIICKWLIKQDKSLKDYICKGSFYFREYADDNHDALEYAKYRLDYGDYAVDLGKDNFAVLKVQSQDEYDQNEITWQLYFIGDKALKNRNKMLERFEELKDLNHSNRRNYIYYLDGRPAKDAVFKTFDKMVLREKDTIIEYIDNWMDNIPAYFEKNVPAKLSILLYGKPGTGKSSFAQALARHLELNSITSVPPEYFSYSGGNNGEAPQSAPTDSIFVIDEIDCACNSRETDDSKENKKALSKLLDFLDNPPTSYIKAKDGKYYSVSIVVATTNYIDKLDEAVKRYGRFDRQLELKYFNKSEAQEMCDIFGVDYSLIPGDINKPKFSISPAQLQALCIENIDNSLKNEK